MMEAPVRILMTTLFVLVLVPRHSRAAEPRPQGSGFVVRAAAGVGIGGMDVAGESERKPGFAGGALLGLAGRRFEFDFEIAAQPFRVDNPLGGEAFRVVYFVPSLRIHDQHAYVRVGVGGARYSLSGPRWPNGGSDGGPAASAALRSEI